MKIALVSPFEEPVPPKTYGGTELVVYNLAEELVAMGHDVTVYASGDSRTSAELESIFEVSLRSDPMAQDLRVRDALKLVGISRIVERINLKRFDVIHNHLSWRLLPFSNLFKAPVVTTLHGPINTPAYERIFQLFRDSYYISISDAQRRPMPELNFLATVYNGIDCSSFTYQETPSEYFVFLGRFSREKGPQIAIRAARDTGTKLIMAGKVDVVDQEYFESTIKPEIDGDQIRYIGEVNHLQKNELLGGARAILVPIDWEEPFGLVMVEALATGTPVIAFPRGSVPELIQEDVGVVAANYDAFVAGMRRIDTISRSRCRDYVCGRFDRAHMAQGYIRAYEKAMASGEPPTMIASEPRQVHIPEYHQN